MFCPEVFRQDDPAALHALIHDHPLGTLITAVNGDLQANLLPFELVESETGDCLRAHLARANTQLAALRVADTVLVVFHGPQAYVTPAYYPSKAVHGKAVPTWNYSMVQVRGCPRVIDDAVWLRAQVTRLTGRREASRAPAWRVEDAPADYIDAMLRGIVGLEIPVSGICGKAKLSQNRSAEDRAGVMAGLQEDGAADVVGLMRP